MCRSFGCLIKIIQLKVNEQLYAIPMPLCKFTPSSKKLYVFLTTYDLHQGTT